MPAAVFPGETVEVAIPAGDVVTAEVPATTPYEPSREEIAALAYSYWEARGCQGGCPEEDWVRAEQELRQSTAPTA